MKRWNFILALGAAVVLAVTVAVLNWLRVHVQQEVERSVSAAAAAFDRQDLTHGPGGDRLVRFVLAEDLVERAKLSPYIVDARLSRTLPDGREVSIVPYTALAAQGTDWAGALAGWRSLEAGPEGRPFGRLYLQLDYAVLKRLHLAIGAVAGALVLVLLTLVARMFSQESRLTRTRVELSERRRELIRMERLALGGQLAAGLIHDLRKPVQNIRHNLDEINEALGDFAPAATSLQELRDQAGLFFNILTETQLERFVQSDHASEEYLEVGPLIEQSTRLVRYERRAVNVSTHIDSNLPLVVGQPPRLIQLFSNLILNAYQVLKGTGTLGIHAAADESWVTVSVADSGPGVPPDLAEKIFDPFFTTRENAGGSGMGLAICRMIVEDMGGTLRLENPVEGGAMFVVQLPAESAGP